MIFSFANTAEAELWDLIIEFNLDKARDISLNLYNSSGEFISEYNLGYLNLGEQQTTISCGNIPDGAYYFVIEGEEQYLQTGKFVISK